MPIFTLRQLYAAKVYCRTEGAALLKLRCVRSFIPAPRHSAIKEKVSFYEHLTVYFFLLICYTLFATHFNSPYKGILFGKNVFSRLYMDNV